MKKTMRDTELLCCYTKSYCAAIDGDNLIQLVMIDVLILLGPTVN